MVQEQPHNQESQPEPSTKSKRGFGQMSALQAELFSKCYLSWVFALWQKCRGTNGIHRNVCSDKQTIAICWHTTCHSLYDEFLQVERSNEICTHFKMATELFKLLIAVFTSASKFSAMSFHTILMITIPSLLKYILHL